ncbi:hypothetical protein WP12_17805 [Sphingomonas sp. SRS2]|nr:hypothetical protein WP12_17805 [Sphingomonas sp. SRS2]
MLLMIFLHIGAHQLGGEQALLQAMQDARFKLVVVNRPAADRAIPTGSHLPASPAVGLGDDERTPAYPAGA